MDDAERLFNTETEKQKTNIEEDGKQDADMLREELLKLADDGEIERTTASIKKAGEKTLRKWHAEVDKKREKKANEFLTDLLLSKFAGVLGGLQAIEDEEILARELQRDELLRRDVMRVVAALAPYVPPVGLISGGVTVATHVMSRKVDKN